MYIIYKLTNTINNKFYIGKTTKTLDIRFSRHVKSSKKNNIKNSAIHLAMKKYGVNNFIIEEIDTALTIKELNEKEKYWISYYRESCSDKMYNIANGGDGGATCNGYTWYTDGVNDYYISKNEVVPDNLIKGRSKRCVDNSDTMWINNGKIQKHIKINDIDKYSGWSHGMLERSAEWHRKVKKTLTSKEIRDKSKEALIRFHKEHLHWTNQTSFKKGNEPSNKGKIAITNNIENKYIDKKDLEYWCDKGWHRGFTIHKNK